MLMSEKKNWNKEKNSLTGFRVVSRSRYKTHNLLILLCGREKTRLITPSSKRICFGSVKCETFYFAFYSVITYSRFFTLDYFHLICTINCSSWDGSGFCIVLLRHCFCLAPPQTDPLRLLMKMVNRKQPLIEWFSTEWQLFAFPLVLGRLHALWLLERFKGVLSRLFWTLLGHFRARIINIVHLTIHKFSS